MTATAPAKRPMTADEYAVWLNQLLAMKGLTFADLSGGAIAFSGAILDIGDSAFTGNTTNGGSFARGARVDDLIILSATLGTTHTFYTTHC